MKQPESRYIPKGLQLTGPDDLGIQLGKPTGTRTDLGQTRSQGGEGAPLAVVDYAGEPTESATREQNIAAREKARSVVERARAELRSTGEVSSETFGNLREATRTGAIPLKRRPIY